MTQQELLPNFSAALDAGLPEAGLPTDVNNNFMQQQYNETDSQLFVNAIGNKGLIGGVIGAAAGIGGTLLVKDLVNKSKRKKEDKKRQEQEAATAAEAAAAAAAEKDALIKNLQDQVSAQTPASGGKDKTMMYVGIGVGVLVLLVGVAAIARR